MATKPGAKDWIIKEQIVDDSEVTGLTLKFEARPDGEYAIHMTGDFDFGNRTLVFDPTGEFAGAGTSLTGNCALTWIKDSK